MTKKRILVVDDEAGFTEMVKLNLEATGRYEVKVENDSTRATDAAIKYRPHLILLDVIMPDAEGPDVVCHIRKNDLVKDIPIVFLTATVTKDEVNEHCGNIGGHEFLAKPVSIKEMINCIEKQIQLYYP